MFKNDRLRVDYEENTIVNLYHLNIFKSVLYLKENFSDVKVVLMGGKASRMRSLAERMQEMCGHDNHKDLIDLSGDGGRFSMFNTNKVIFLSHGMGIPSISIALEEVTKMLHFAGAKDVIYIRVGTCGGLGLDPGTIVLTEKCYSPKLEDYLEIFVCGKSIRKPAVIDHDLVQLFFEFSKKSESKRNGQKIVIASTMCANTFYEEQARLDGCVCSISEKDKHIFFEKLIKEYKIQNIEMESLGFAAFCHNLGIKGLIVAVILVDRMVSENVTLSHDDIEKFQRNLNDLVLDFVLTKIK